MATIDVTDRTAPLSIDARRQILQGILRSDTSNGWRVTTQTDTSASLTKGGTNHLLHFLIGLFTLTVWWWGVWWWWALLHRKQQRYVEVDEYGGVRRS